MGDGSSSVLHTFGVALAALVIWFICLVTNDPHGASGRTAPATAFSAARAEAVLARLLGPERPHPVGSAENAAVRARILAELARLGVSAQSYRAFTCDAWHGASFIPCATVVDIVAEAIPGSGKAIVLLAHCDSVPAGPGASDDESSVATLIETIRALRARAGKSLHPVIAVFTDGEESGLLGANAFLQNAALKNRVGVVINAEARGTRGPSLLFQTSPGDGRLIDLYADSVATYATSSLYAEIYKFLPNDTDLTLFIRDGFPSFNFAFVDNVRYYHSPFDLRRNLDPASLQMQGDNVLAVTASLEHTEFSALQGGNDIYLNLFGVALPRLPANWALPLSILAFLAIAAAAWFAPDDGSAGKRAWIGAALAPPALILGAASFGWLLYFIAQDISDRPDPTYAYPLAMRVALAFGVWTIALLVSRTARAQNLAASAWLWMAGLSIAAAATLPGLSPYFLFPSLMAAILLLLAAPAHGGWSGSFGQKAQLLCVLGAFAVWFPLVVSGETLMGLRLHPLFTVPVALGLMAALPLLAARPLPRAIWFASLALGCVVAFAGAVIQGSEPGYSAASPQRVNLAYFEDGSARARWIADTSWKATATEPLPDALIKVGSFHYDSDAWGNLGFGDGYEASAGAPHYALPTANVANDQTADGARIVTLSLRGDGDTDGMLLGIPANAALRSVDMRGQHVTTERKAAGTQIGCYGRDCRSLDVTLAFGNRGAVALTYAELHYGLPAFGARLQAARPTDAMASQSGDETFLANTLTLPAR